MLEINPEIKDMSNEEIKQKIELLKLINCTEKQIINIISSNALYLSIAKVDYLKLITYLSKLGFNTLNILFDSNPYILDLAPYEIEQYIYIKQKEGILLEDIIDELESNPYLFSEII
jgi:hypothetical protein